MMTHEEQFESLRAEHDALTRKQTELALFMNGDGLTALPFGEQTLVMEQQGVMCQYMAVLRKRMQALAKRAI